MQYKREAFLQQSAQTLCVAKHHDGWNDCTISVWIIGNGVPPNPARTRNGIEVGNDNARARTCRSWVALGGCMQQTLEPATEAN